MTASARRTAREKVNNLLHKLGLTYHDGLPVQRVNEILAENGFGEMEPAIYCGRDGTCIDSVGDHTFLSFTWHKMDITGRYEIVAYVN